MAARDPISSSLPPSACLLRACTQTVSWSKNGIICYALAFENGPNLNITFLENTDGKNWQLAPAQGLTIRPLDSRIAYPLVMVQWSNISTDLAVFDELGNFYILLAGVGLLRNQRLQKLQTPFGKSANGNVNASNQPKSTAAGSKLSPGENNKNDDSSEAPSYELTSYNHTEMIYRDIQQLSTTKQVTQGSCVAFKWLAVDKPQIVNKSANWSAENRSYVYGIQQYKPSLLAHPIPTKQACLAVRRCGIVNLYYQGEHKVEYHKLSVDLSAVTTGNALQITSASIGFTADKKIVVVAHDSALNQILTYSLTLDWGFLVVSALRQSKDPHYHTPKEEQTAPSMVAVLVHQMKPAAAATAITVAETENDTKINESNDFIKSENDFGKDLDAMDLDPQTYNDSMTGGHMSSSLATSQSQTPNVTVEQTRLVLIDVLSPYYAQTDALDVLITYEIVCGGKYSFTTQRFRYTDVATTLASCFAAINGLGTAQTGQLFTLILEDEISAPGQFKSVSLALLESIILFVLETGELLPFSRNTWKLILSALQERDKEQEENGQTNRKSEPVSTISSLLDCGFAFPTLPCKNSLFSFAISPNMACVVYLPSGGVSTTSNGLELSHLMLQKISRLNDHNLTSIGLAHTHAHACYSNACSDDLMALVKVQYELIGTKEEKAGFLEKLSTEAHGAINFHLSSFGKESVDKLMSNPPLQKLLSLQLALSDLSDNKKTRDIAWVVLNLRFTSFVIMFTLSNIYRQMSKKKSVDDSLEDSVHRAECVYSLIGNVKWLIDFIVYLNQELAQMSLSGQEKGNSYISVENSVALPVILCKIPRLFLMYALSSIGKTHEILKKLHKELSESNKLFTPMKEALDRFFGACTSLPWKIANFETFLRDCEANITKEVALKLMDAKTQLRLEQDLFCRGKIPSEYLQMAAAILERHAQSMGRDTNLLALFFYDTNWISIGVADNQLCKTQAHNHPQVQAQAHNQPNQNQKFTGTFIRQPYSKHEAVDVLRKIFITCSSPVFSGGPSQMGRGYISAEKVRKCVRCRSVSLVADPLVFESPHVIALWTMVFQRTCICGSAWVNCIYT